MTNHRHRILVIDDEPQIHRFLRPALEAAGYEAERADNAADGLRIIASRPPDAVFLDLGLPDLDGMAALEKARAFYNRPILVLSARDREIEKIKALDLGADDYIEKPFGVGELLARLRAALRHKIQQSGGSPIIKAGNVNIDRVRRLVTIDGRKVKLAPKEYEILILLAEYDGRILAHRQLLTAVWGPAHDKDVQYLRVLVGQLRQKLEINPAKPEIITTEPGIGYRFHAD